MSLGCRFLFIILCCFIIHAAAFADILITEPEAGRQPLLSIIKQARSNLDLVMYGFTDEELLQALIEAKKHGKEVRILLQHFPYQAPEENLSVIQKFSAAHVQYTFNPSTFYFLHQKTLLIDKRLALIMTFNFTRPTFKNQRNFGLVVSDPTLVKEIQEVFEADWKNRKFSPNQPNLIWSPDNSRSKILKLIQGAKSSIQIYAQNLSDHQIIGALAKAACHNVVVQVLTSAPLPRKKWNYLQNAGVQFRIDNHNIIHAKAMIIDSEKAMLGSINFTRASIDMNRELSIITNESKIVAELLKIFQSDWEWANTLMQAPAAISRVSHQNQNYSSLRHDRHYASCKKALLLKYPHHRITDEVAKIF